MRKIRGFIKEVLILIALVVGLSLLCDFIVFIIRGGIPL